MLIPPNVLNVAGCASKDAARYQLCGVYLQRHEPRRCSATATDGKVLAHVTWAEDDTAEFPVRDGFDAMRACAETATIIPTDAIKRLVSLAPKDPNIPILANLAMDERSLNGTATFLGTDIASDRRETVRTVEGTFPDYTAALSCEPVATVGINPFVLIQALETFVKTMGWKKSEHKPYARLELCGDKPIAIRGSLPDRQVTTLAMPLIEKP